MEIGNCPVLYAQTAVDMANVVDPTSVAKLAPNTAGSSTIPPQTAADSEAPVKGDSSSGIGELSMPGEGKDTIGVEEITGVKGHEKVDKKVVSSESGGAAGASEEGGEEKKAQKKQKRKRKDFKNLKSGFRKSSRTASHQDMTTASLKQLAQALVTGSKVVFLTGAGLSVASGIPPFRGEANAVWTQVRQTIVVLIYEKLWSSLMWRCRVCESGAHVKSLKNPRWTGITLSG